MNKAFDYFIPLIGGIVYLLMLKGVIKLPQEKQMRFDQYVFRRKNLLTTLTYALIAFSLIMIAKRLFFE
jgi:hypothetical protein